MVQEKNILRLGLTIIMFIALLGLVSTPALANGHNQYGKRACSKTASSAYLACQYEVKDDYWIAKGNCYNLSDEDAQDECFDEAKEDYQAAKEECKDQLEARKDLCEELGEAPYDPPIDPEDFIDFEDVIDGGSFTSNPYFPLVVGNTWVYEGETEEGTETITVTVLSETKEILGVKCIVVSDIVALGGDVIEDTKDWYAQDEDGNVWYFGEISKEFEDGELVSIDGSWTAGVEGAKPGKIMFANPEEGVVYRQEFALGDAEDWAKVLSVEVVAAVGAYICAVADGCLQTEEGTPIEPDVSEYKFYKPGTGLILEVNAEDPTQRVELVSGP